MWDNCCLGPFCFILVFFFFASVKSVYAIFVFDETIDNYPQAENILDKS
jgi:hypothetical protein